MTPQLNKSLAGIAIPPRVKKLAISPTGFYVPWFVTWFDANGQPCHYGEGTPDFRVISPLKWGRAIRAKLCWVCGEPLGKFNSFVIGPMCAVNRVTSEPPNHMECAVFAAKACPFLSRPRARRNDKDLPAQAESAAGFGIDRNPGVACVWTCKDFRVFRASMGNEGFLISLGIPTSVLWFADGREATREQVLASIDSGYPLLLDIAKVDGDEAIVELSKQRERALAYLPAT